MAKSKDRQTVGDLIRDKFGDSDDIPDEDDAEAEPDWAERSGADEYRSRPGSTTS